MQSHAAARLLFVAFFGLTLATFAPPAATRADPAPTPIYGPLGPTPSAPPPQPPVIRVCSNSADFTAVQYGSVTAHCHPGETPLGGGFTYGYDQAPYMGVVTGSYPATDGWTIAYNSAATGKGWTPYKGPAPTPSPIVAFTVDGVTAYAYCLTETLPVVVRTLSNAEAPVEGSYAPFTQSITVLCPVGQTVVGGGYSVDNPYPVVGGGYSVDNPYPVEGGYNSGVSASLPAVPISIAEGWHLDISSILSPIRPTTAYVRCAGKPIVPKPAVKSASDLSQSVPAAGVFSFSLRCPEREQMTAVGNAYHGDFRIPHPVYATHSLAPDGQALERWSIMQLLAYQTAPYGPDALCQKRCTVLLGAVLHWFMLYGPTTTTHDRPNYLAA